MKNSTIKILAGLITMFVFQACQEDFLEKVNPNTLDSSNFGYTKEEATNLIVAAYSPLNHNLSYGRWQQIIDNLRSDEVYAEGTGEGRIDLDEFAGLSANIGAIKFPWESYYTSIFRANLALELISERALSGPDAEKVMVEIGEAHFLRAYNYFWLLLNYQNIPLITSSPEDRDAFYAAQENPEVVWEFVIQEFTNAKPLLPDSWSNEYLGRATKGAAAACLGRAYLYRYNFFKDGNDLQKAKENFEEVLSMGYSLTPDYFANFSLEGEFNEESLFEIPFVTYNGLTNYGLNHPSRFFGSMRGQEFGPLETGSWSGQQPTTVGFEAFTDTTFDGNIDPRRDATFHYNKPGETLYGKSYHTLYGNESDYVGWKKYQVSMYPEMYPAERINGLWPPLNYREFRLGDLLLLLAEVENEMGNISKAVEYVNRVRERAGVVPLDPSNFDKAMLSDQLVHERSVELMGEGKRWYDLLRWGKLEQYIKPIRPSFTPGIHEYLPIPANEMATNPNIVQNNGY